MIPRRLSFALLATLVCVSCGLGFGVDVPSAQDSDPNATTGDATTGDTGLDFPGESSASGGAATGGLSGNETGGAGGEGGSAF